LDIILERILGEEIGQGNGRAVRKHLLNCFPVVSVDHKTNELG
jgi:hypothetical protein